MKHRPFLQTLFISPVLILALFTASCSSTGSTRNEEIRNQIQGHWTLNKRETLIRLYQSRGDDFLSLERTRQWEIEQSFTFGFEITFDGGSWQGRFMEKGVWKDGKGEFLVQGEDGDRIQVQTIEETPEGVRKESLLIQFETEDQILLAMGEKGRENLSLVLNRSAEE